MYNAYFTGKMTWWHFLYSLGKRKRWNKVGNFTYKWLKLEEGCMEFIIFFFLSSVLFWMKIFEKEMNAHGQIMTPLCFAYRCPFSSPSWWLSYPCFWFWPQSSANLHGSISTVCYLCWAALYFISFLSTISLDGLRKSQVSINWGTALLLVKVRQARHPVASSFLILPGPSYDRVLRS